jgi:hypothetical protein
MISFPRAEAFARKMALPVTHCADTKELYGYKQPVLDRKAAISALCAAGFYTNTEAHEVALEILEERIGRLAEKCH